MIRAIIALMFLATSAFAQQPAPVKLAWTHSTDNVAVTGYNIYRDGKKIGSSPTTSYTDATVAPTTQYSYTVSAFDAAGNESDTSMPYVIKTGTIIILPPGGDVTFTPTALRFMSPTGSDGANGLTPATAWASPNHAMNCGDVLLAGPGTYSSGIGNFGAVSNCPSTSAGIDGSGGIYFATLLCAGTDLTSCDVTGGTPAIGLSNDNNWAVEGFQIHPGVGHRGIEWRIVGSCAQLFTNHHLAAINNVIFNTDAAIAVNDGGCVNGSNPPALDYIAAVGNIAQNSAQDNICLGAIDFVGTGATDSATTAIKGYMAGNFSWHNRNTNCDASFDNEGLMFDTLDAHGSNGIWVAQNNIAWDNGRYGFQHFYQCSTAVVATVNVINNTLFANNAGNVPGTATSIAGDLNIAINSGCGSPNPYIINVFNNIAKTNWANAGGGSGTNADLYAYLVGGGTFSNVTTGGGSNLNVFKGKQTACQNFHPGVTTCDAGFNVESTDGNYIGTNTYVDPVFNDETDLLTNRVGAPNCAGFKTTTACMGWNVSMGSLTVPSVISDLTANCAGCSGKGYQRPSTTCAANPYYPTWLKGIVRLEASSFTAGATITQKADLVTKPCGM